MGESGLFGVVGASGSSQLSFNGAAPGAGGWALDCTLSGHTDGVLGLALSTSRRHAFSASNDRTVRVWELRGGGVCLQVLRSFESSVSALGWHRSSGCLATGAEDGLVQLWDVSALEEGGSGDGAADGEGSSCSLAQTLRIEHCEVLCIATTLDGTALLCGLDDGSLALLTDSGNAE